MLYGYGATSTAFPQETGVLRSGVRVTYEYCYGQALQPRGLAHCLAGGRSTVRPRDTLYSRYSYHLETVSILVLAGPGAVTQLVTIHIPSAVLLFTIIALHLITHR